MSRANDRCITPCPKAADPNMDPHEWDHTPFTGGASFVCRRCGEETIIGNFSLPPTGPINWAPGWGLTKEECVVSIDEERGIPWTHLPDEAVVLPKELPPQLSLRIVSACDEYGRPLMGTGPSDIKFLVVNTDTGEVVGELINVSKITYSIDVYDQVPKVELTCVGVGFDLSLGAVAKFALGSADPVLKPATKSTTRVLFDLRVGRVVDTDPYHMCTGMGYGEDHRCVPPFVSDTPSATGEVK